MSETADAPAVISAPVLWAVAGVALLWAVWGLASHPGFQPIQLLRGAAPILALLAGGGFTRRLARLRRQVDGEREFDRGGKALFMGFVMVGATALAWLLLSQAIPATLTALAGTPGTEVGLVSRKVPATADAGCQYRLEVVSAAANGAVRRPYDECVDEALWSQVAAGDPLSLRLVKGVLGAELVGVGPAGDTH
jgi:hypothetical protein